MAQLQGVIDLALGQFCQYLVIFTLHGSIMIHMNAFPGQYVYLGLFY